MFVHELRRMFTCIFFDTIAINNGLSVKGDEAKQKPNRNRDRVVGLLID